jgi:serine/threonine-protein kinase
LGQVIETMASVHEAKAIYPELHSTTTLFTAQDEVWLTDFGVSELLLGKPHHAMSHENRRTEGEDFCLRHPGYVTPEEWSGKSGKEPTADVFRLGALFYQALTLELPYGIAPISARRTKPVAPSKRQSWIPKSLDAVILRALEFDPSQRYASASELRDDWKHACQHVPWGFLRKWVDTANRLWRMFVRR